MFTTIVKALVGLSPIILLGGGYLFYMNQVTELKQLREERVELDLRMDSLVDTIRRDREKFDELSKELDSLYTDMRQSEERTRDLITTLQDHDLTYLTLEKPGLIETRINRGTRNVFENLERLTALTNNNGM